ncbi:hypothetical protein [Neorhizobium tomejilense]|uniref:DUF5983 family protein n=1 Tax=Neorhizobium tomejilense TaxID=2093828 RepID=UPI000CF8D71F|nr:hypothetical protein [Neorhizobium tomejilense]
MKLPRGCLSVNSAHLNEDTAYFLAEVHPYDWPFPGGQFGRYAGWFCQCVIFDPLEAGEPFTNGELLEVFEFVKSRKFGWVMFHADGTLHSELTIYRQFNEDLDPYLRGLYLKRQKADWRRSTEKWLASLKLTENF